MFEDLHRVVHLAAAEAASRRHEYICVEHLLFAVAKTPEGEQLLKDCGASVGALLKRLEDFFTFKLERVAEGMVYQPHQTLGFQRVIQAAVVHATNSSARRLTAGDILAAIFLENDSHAVFFLNEQGLTRLDVLEYISHSSDASPLADESGEESGGEENIPFPGAISPEEAEQPDRSGSKALEKYAVDLNAKASRGEIDPLIGRDREIERAIQVLCRRTKNNPLFVGDQGVGKTAIVEGLALKIVNGEVPERVKHLRIFSLDLGSLIAGTKYRGDFEQRLKGVLKALDGIDGAVLFLDEIQTIVGAGATSGGTLDAANLLKPVLTSGKLRCIGSTTFEEYKNHFEKDRAFARRFLKIEVVEPSIEETLQILRGLKERFEDHHQVHYTDSALKAAAELSGKYINERFLPDKAIDVVDEAGATVSLAAAEKQKGAAGEAAGKRPAVRPIHIEQVVAKIAKIPPKTVSTTDREKLKRLESDLTAAVFGQDEAIAALARSIRRSRAGLLQESKPIGSFLFVGPTGVGKTEVSKQLASVLELELLRFDMSEYMEKHTVARLIGAPPGYIGFDQGGLLTDAILRHPHAVLLLDEIEKAHPDIFNILLQVMDNAMLTDTTGRKADFRNVILIMTSNVGSEGIHGQPIGFGNTVSEAGMGAVDRAFRPEFRNRLDMIVKFKPLPIEVVERIVDKFVSEIARQLEPKGVRVVIAPEARSWIASHGYSAQYGARSIHRLVQSDIKDPLADAILFGPLASGGTAVIGLEGEKLCLKFEDSPHVKPPLREKSPEPA